MLWHCSLALSDMKTRVSWLPKLFDMPSVWQPAAVACWPSEIGIASRNSHMTGRFSCLFRCETRAARFSESMACGTRARCKQ